MFTSFIQYLLLAPSFTNVINVCVFPLPPSSPLVKTDLSPPSSSLLETHSYAFCNVNDVTWGNRPEEKQSNDLGAAPAKEGGVDVAVPTDEKDMYVSLYYLSSLPLRSRAALSSSFELYGLVLTFSFPSSSPFSSFHFSVVFPQHSNAAYDDACHVLAQKAPPEVKSVNMEEKMTDSYRAIRTNLLLVYVMSNGALVAGILSTNAGSVITTTATNVYMAFLLYSVAGSSPLCFLPSREQD